MYKKIIRGQEPKLAMGIGLVKYVEDWLNEQKPYESGYSIRRDEVNKVFIVDVEGDVVLEDFEIVNTQGLKGYYTVEFGDVTGRITRLYELTHEEIYKRIQEFYEDFLKECLGKTHEEQEEILYGKIGSIKNPPNFHLGPGLIEDSRDYVKNLPVYPALEQMRDLVKQVISGCLEYAYYAKDAYSVEMNLYAKMMNTNLPFYEHLVELKNLSLELKTDANKMESLRQIFLHTDYYFENNENKFSKIQLKPISRFSEKTIIKYLLICEAPPSSGKYFYAGTSTSLFTTVWNTFFRSKVCSNQVEAFHCLANLGFLLVDTLPYSLNYKSLRNKPAYDKLIKTCLPWWTDKLNKKFTFAPDLKIAFGFKLNAMSVIKATTGSICLGGNNFSLTPNLIATTGAGQPSTGNLERIFQITFKHICSNCP